MNGEPATQRRPAEIGVQDDAGRVDHGPQRRLAVAPEPLVAHRSTTAVTLPESDKVRACWMAARERLQAQRAEILRASASQDSSTSDAEQRAVRSDVPWTAGTSQSGSTHPMRATCVTALQPTEHSCIRGVAQPGRAPGSGPGGRRFESSRPDHLSDLY